MNRRKNSTVSQVTQYELDKIHITNFRSIKNQEIHLKPLTIVVGGNSAGKSSLLKALLLFAQSQREWNSRGEISLNGSWVRLEQFKSVVHGSNLDEEIRIGLHFAITERRRIRTTDLVISRDRFGSRNRSKIAGWNFEADRSRSKGLGYEIHIGKSDQNRGIGLVNQIRFELPNGQLLARRQDQFVDDPADLGGRFSGFFLSTDDQSSETVSGVVLSGAIAVVYFVSRPLIDVLMDEVLATASKASPMTIDRLQRQTRGHERDVAQLLTELREEVREGHWPGKGDPSDAAGKLLARVIGNSLSSVDVDSLLSEIQSVGYERVAEEVARDIVQDCTQIFAEIIVNDELFGELSNIVKIIVRHETDPRTKKQFLARNYSSNPVALLVRAALRQFEENDLSGQVHEQFLSKTDLWITPIPVLLENSDLAGGWELDDFMRRGVHYLGPLRSAPSSATDYSMRGSERGVGPEGQHLAYQLMVNPTISGFQWSRARDQLRVDEAETKFVQALSYWVQELNLALSVRAEEVPGVGDAIKLGVVGVQAELSPNDVGVGVSQALPVLAAVLLANPGDLVVLEQPELHLHPDAQLKLTEFFVAAMQSGRRLLIESHSEHFLNQLRLMTARAGSGVAEQLINNVGFVFAERGESGLTEFREVKLASDGSVQDWPKGFFDHGGQAARELFLLKQRGSEA